MRARAAGGNVKATGTGKTDMKKIAAISALVAISTANAGAADLPRGSYLAPAPYSAFSWGGPYVGANLGYQWGSISNSGGSPSGVLGGGQVGYNWQSGQMVFGAETDLQASGADDTLGLFKFSNDWFGTLRGRVGFAMSNILLYGTAGLAYGDTKVQFAGLSETRTHVGWAVGAGMEIGLTPNWSAKVEYLFIDLSNEHFALTGLDHDFESNLLRFGVNYRF